MICNKSTFLIGLVTSDCLPGCRSMPFKTPRKVDQFVLSIGLLTVEELYKEITAETS